MKTSVFATSNNIKKLSSPLQSRFFIVELEPYTYERFLEITNELLSHRKVVGDVASMIALMRFGINLKILGTAYELAN